jgi:hypothetical protein
VAERRGLDVYSLEQCRRQLVRDMVKYDEVVARGSPRSLEADGLLGCIGADVDVLAAAFRYVTSVALKGEDALP